MFKLVRFLRPYVVGILFVFILLFAQAMTDLALPDYMSRIVNTGIQQYGIEDPVPEVMRSSRVKQVLLLLPPDAAREVEASWQPLERQALSEASWNDLVKRYPLLETTPLVFKEKGHLVSEETRQDLTRALALFSLAEQDSGPMADQFNAQELFAMLDAMSDELREPFLASVRQNLDAIPESFLNQTAITWIADEYETIGIDLADLQRSFILRIGGLMLLVALFGAVCAVSVGFFAARIAAGVARDLRLATFTRVEHFAGSEYDQFSTASLITRTTNDVQQIQMALVMLMRILFFAPILGTGGVIKALNSNVSMGWIIALAVAILMTLVLVLFNVAVPRFKKIQKLVDRVNRITREFLSGLMVIRAFNTQPHEEQRFEKANQDLTRVNLFVSRLMAMTMPLMMLVMNGISLLIVWFGARQVDLGTMQVGDIMAFIQYTMQIIMSFLMLSMIFIMLPRASVSGQRIAEVLAVKPSIVDPLEPAAFDPDKRGFVVFDHVTFRYPNAEADVLHDISFEARPGQTTAIIGSTGCGKSTLVNLIPRFYDTTRGCVCVNGVNVRGVNQADLRDRIGYVAQKGVLFTGSIRDNIAYGKKQADDHEIREAAKTAQALDFIESSDEGFGTPIAQGGSNVSGGQKQRLSIARALVREPDIFIFDDAFSALDFQTDAALRRALKEQTQDATLIIVASRIGTIRHAEQIIVLDEGKIVGLGRHEDLLKTCSVYYEIAASQLSEKELTL